MPFTVGIVRPDDPDVAALLQRHLALMRAQTPPESCHVLPAEALAADDIVLFGLRENGVLLGVGALRRTGDAGEIKSMHTAAETRGRGVARAVLDALIEHARGIGLVRLNLETGSGLEHAAARHLYATAGFDACEPFGDYVGDPLSHFMTHRL